MNYSCKQGFCRIDNIDGKMCQLLTKIGKICTEVFKLMEELVQARVANLKKNAAESMKQCAEGKYEAI